MKAGTVSQLTHSGTQCALDVFHVPISYLILSAASEVTTYGGI